MTRALNVIPNGVRDLMNLGEVLRFAQDDRIENARRI